MPLQPHIQAPACTRLHSGSVAAGTRACRRGALMGGLVAGRLSCPRLPLPSASRSLAPGGVDDCVVMLHLGPRPPGLCAALCSTLTYAGCVISQGQVDHERRPAVPTIASHPYKASEQEARQGQPAPARVRTWSSAALQGCRHGRRCFSVRGFFQSHVRVLFHVHVHVWRSCFLAAVCCGGCSAVCSPAEGYVAGWWLALYATTMVYGWMGVSDCAPLPACLVVMTVCDLL